MDPLSTPTSLNLSPLSIQTDPEPSTEAVQPRTRPAPREKDEVVHYSGGRGEAAVCTASLPSPAQQKQLEEELQARCSHQRLYCEDNGFEIPTPHAKPTSSGSVSQHLVQSALTGLETAGAVASKLGAMPDPVAAATLAMLSPTPPLSTGRVEYAEYTSRIAGAPPDRVLEQFLAHPADTFGAAGIQLRPPPSRLTEGAKVFLEEPGFSPPVWAPVQVRIDVERKVLRFETLDGHPLRGINEFRFEADGDGTRILQRSWFQLSSGVVELAAQNLPGDPIQRQHDIWQAVQGRLNDTVYREE